jgi:hypothetical protein
VKKVKIKIKIKPSVIALLYPIFLINQLRSESPSSKIFIESYGYPLNPKQKSLIKGEEFIPLSHVVGREKVVSPASSPHRKIVYD